MTPVVPRLTDVFYTAMHVGCLLDDYFRVARGRFRLVVTKEFRGTKCQEFAAGLQPLVVEWLDANGYDVHVAGSPRKLNAPNQKGLRQFSPRDNAALDFVREHDRGFIRYAPGEVSPAKLIAQVAAAWPRKRILVLATRVRDVRSLEQQLDKMVGGVTAHYGEHMPEKPGRIAVSTYASSSEGAIEREKREILIALDPAELMRSMYGRHSIQDSWRARVYGLLPIGAALAPYDRDRLLSVFGTQQLFVWHHGIAGVGWRVLFDRIENGAAVPDGLTPTQQKRRLIWNNAFRNRRIARLAGCLREWNEAALQVEFPAVSKAVFGRLPTRIGVLVENVEHAIVLADILGWPIVAGSSVCQAGLPGKRTAWLNRRRTIAQSVVVTYEGAKDTERFQILVRADGGGGIPDCLKILCAQKFTVIVDFNDRYHPLVRRNFAARREAYVSAGHQVLRPGDGETSPLQRFVESRPEVDD